MAGVDREVAGQIAAGRIWVGGCDDTAGPCVLDPPGSDLEYARVGNPAAKTHRAARMQGIVEVPEKLDCFHARGYQYVLMTSVIQPGDCASLPATNISLFSYKCAV